MLYTCLFVILSRRRPAGATTFWGPRGGGGSRTGRTSPARGVCRPKARRAAWEWGSLKLEAGDDLGRYKAEELAQASGDTCSHLVQTFRKTHPCVIAITCLSLER